MTNNTNKAFSIAEVLVTMMVVSLIVIMTAPVITRKKVNTTAQSTGGSWTCTLDANGNAVASDGSVSTDGKSCIFNPQSGAKEYSVYVIGGGGGGAAGSDSNFSVSSFGQSVTAQVPETAKYDYLLVGGGGGGSSYKMFGYPSRLGCNGSAGNVKSGSVELSRGAQVHLAAGSGGIGGYVLVNSNLPSFVTSGPGILQEEALPGNSSFFTSSAGIFEATGGAAGDYEKYSGCSNIHVSSQSEQYIKNFTEFDSATALLIGKGGNGSQCGIKASAGNNGLAFLKSALITGGGGGSAGEVVYKNIKTLPGNVVVKVGLGGAGGSVDNQDGYQGQPSAFGNYAIATGGEGGKSGAITTTDTIVTGKQGQPSPLGGYHPGGRGVTNANNDMDNNNGVVVTPGNYYGAGGGGGGYRRLVGRPSPSENASDYGVGKGGRGDSGIVRVEWN